MKTLGTPIATLTIGLLLTGCSMGGNTSTSSPQGGTAVASTAPSGSATNGAGGQTNDDIAFCNSGGPGNPALAMTDAMNGNAEQAKARIEASLAAAPAEIKPDVQVLADIDIPILEGKVPQDQIDNRVSDPRVVPALKHIAQWVKDHCAGVTPATP